MKVCVTNVLQPSVLEGGIQGIWAPRLDASIGYCEYECNLCGTVCPTGAIRRLSVEAKKKQRIGLAVIDRNLCLPWKDGTPCLVCEEHCPLGNKAIWIEETEGPDGEAIKRPHVDPELCIGCAVCENKCPVLTRKAIKVFPI